MCLLISRQGSAVHRGYSWPGLEKVSQQTQPSEDTNSTGDTAAVHSPRAVEDVKESFEVGHPINWAQPNVFLPEPILPGFRAFALSFFNVCFAASLDLLHALSLGLGLEETALDGAYVTKNGQLRLLHYPPVARAEVQEGGGKTRMEAHSDWDSLTMLFLKAGCAGGLQVEIGGGFVDVPPVEGAAVMNVGDALMRWSKGELPSTMHRVGIPGNGVQARGEDMLQPRYSIPFFLGPDMDAILEPLPPCIGEGRPAKYEPVSFAEYAAMRARFWYPDDEKDETWQES